MSEDPFCHTLAQLLFHNLNINTMSLRPLDLHRILSRPSITDIS